MYTIRYDAIRLYSEKEIFFHTVSGFNYLAIFLAVKLISNDTSYCMKLSLQTSKYFQQLQVIRNALHALHLKLKQ